MIFTSKKPQSTTLQSALDKDAKSQNAGNPAASECGSCGCSDHKSEKPMQFQSRKPAEPKPLVGKR